MVVSRSLRSSGFPIFDGSHVSLVEQASRNTSRRIDNGCNLGCSFRGFDMEHDGDVKEVPKITLCPWEMTKNADKGAPHGYSIEG